MTEPLSEAEKQILEIAKSEIRIVRLQNRITLLRLAGHPIHRHESSLDPHKARLSRLTATLTKYRCYLLRGDHIRAVQVLESIDDADVVVKAWATLDDHPECDSFEVWDLKRLVARAPREVKERR